MLKRLLQLTLNETAGQLLSPQYSEANGNIPLLEWIRQSVTATIRSQVRLLKCGFIVQIKNSLKVISSILNMRSKRKLS